MIATSIVRDCYVGRRMASVMSLAMMILIAVPVIAPSFGQAVLLVTPWRGIFVVLMLYGLLALAWSVLRLPETLPESERRSLAPADVLAAYWQTVTHRQTLGYALAAGSVMGALFAYDSRPSIFFRHLSPRPLFSARFRGDRGRHRHCRLSQSRNLSGPSACA